MLTKIHHSLVAPMRRTRAYLLLSGAFAVLCWFLHLLTPDYDLARMDSAAALGVLLLGAALLGKTCEALRLPQITGFLLAGILLGPYVTAVVRAPAVERLELVNRLALGIIALTAGGELRLRELRPTIRRVAWQVSARFALVPAIAGGACYFLLPEFLSLPWASVETGVAACLLLGIVAAAISPSTTVAVINETRSAGPLTSRTIAVAIVIDVAVLVAFGLALTVARSLLGGEGHGGHLGLVLAREILGAFPIGAVLGLLTIYYLRRVKEDIPVFLLGVVFAGTEFAHAIHIDPILTCVLIGFIVENFSAQGEALIEGIESVSLPIYAVFFAVAGAQLDLAALRMAGLAALLLVLSRLLATYLACAIAGKASGEDPVVRSYIWMGFIGQAGVSLGMATIIAQELPATIGNALRTIIVGGIVVNQVLGPVLFRVALEKTGEIGRRLRRNP